ncbi:cytochrome P450 [Aspergillus alliaceus]|uniref:cytochrome P450 n=1 Tax=Petromyces alliaceus TaxID=209559 RepID=UPI0012A5AB65|nr:cytochrome P450 [Aspergillus alliaceus]KAB8231208.1 cytochrome P450 [Aspergillus alliaceus]
MDSPRLWLALIGLVSYVLTKIFSRLYFHPLSKIPGPKLAAATHLYEWYYDIILVGKYLLEIERMHEKYGPIVRINPREVHISDPDFYDEIYASSAHKRNKDKETVEFAGVPLSTLATVDHDHHRFRRGLLSNFFSKRSIRELSRLVEEKVFKLLGRFEEFHQQQKVVRVDDGFSALTSDIITHYCYGTSWGYLDDEDMRSDVRQVANDITRLVHVNRAFPSLANMARKLPLWVLYLIQPGRSAVLDLQTVIYEQSKQTLHGEKYDIGHSDANGKHTTIYDQLNDPRIPAEERTLQRLQDEGLLLLAAGTETTARGLAVACFHIASDDRVRARLRDELRAVLPKPDSHVTWAELERLPYLTNNPPQTGTVNEALRLGAFVTLRSPRIAPNETLVYKDYAIPPGVSNTASSISRLSSSSYFGHKNPTIFPEPEKFSPERWILPEQTHKHLSKYLTSFSHGSRMCLGLHLAYLELYLTIAYFVRRFDLELIDTTAEDMKIVQDMGLGYTRRGELSVFAKIVRIYTD